ncbi:MAG: hypothetical protein RL885_14960 [Planctomycetota bacterium]
MRRVRLLWPALLSLLAILLGACASGDREGHTEPEHLEPPLRAALDYLSEHVPRWRPENGCFSCHDNGDGARALYTAARHGASLPPDLDETTQWLRSPSEWKPLEAGSPFEDQELARLQFVTALLAAHLAGFAVEDATLALAAELLASDQAEDGRFLAGSLVSLAAPTTWGPVLGTVMARGALATIDPDRFAAVISRADAYLLDVPVFRVPDACALLLWGARGGPLPDARATEALELLERAQAPGGGFGPFVDAPVEPFDTALAILALDSWRASREEPGLAESILRARASLIASQLEDGSWNETTRPQPYTSHAQRLSTVAWATLSLLETR